MPSPSIDRITVRSAVAWIVVLWACAAYASAQSRCVASRGAQALTGSIGLVPESAAAERLVTEAIAVWRSCGNYGVDFPAFVIDRDVTWLLEQPAITRFVTVRLVPGSGVPGRCGMFEGQSIELYRYARTSAGQLRSCGALALNLAHELGHVLGLRDAPDERRCEDRIMADLSIRNLTGRRVSAEECRVAGRHVTTLAEQRGASSSRIGFAPLGFLRARRSRLP